LSGSFWIFNIFCTFLFCNLFRKKRALMWQHVTVKGIKGAVIESIFKEIAITEMKHAEEIAERLAYLDGAPTIKPDSAL
jgi:bacterioferritin (cytochrome b1)